MRRHAREFISLDCYDFNQSIEHDEGWTAYSMGVSINDCPFSASLERIEWLRGYVTASGMEDIFNPLVSGEVGDID